jgi:predicted aspartyl protease
MMSDNKQYHAFDTEYERVVREISTPVSLFSSHTSAKGKCVETFAVWDTGSTHSVLSPKIVKELGLIPIDSCLVRGINASQISDIVVATISLTGDLHLTGRRFSVNNIPGADVLIGMDIIMTGDFVINNADGKTLFSFVIPPFKNKISFSKKASHAAKRK